MILSTCAVKKVAKKEKGNSKISHNAWICYLKNCAKTTDLTYRDCVKDKSRAEKEYYKKKDNWDAIALKGCL